MGITTLMIISKARERSLIVLKKETVKAIIYTFERLRERSTKLRVKGQLCLLFKGEIKGIKTVYHK